MRVKTIAEAKALVGRAFKDKKGLVRVVTRITDLSQSSQSDAVIGNVYWRRLRGDERQTAQWLPYFNDWLSLSTEIPLHKAKKS